MSLTCNCCCLARTNKLFLPLRVLLLYSTCAPPSLPWICLRTVIFSNMEQASSNSTLCGSANLEHVRCVCCHHWLRTECVHDLVVRCVKVVSPVVG